MTVLAVVGAQYGSEGKGAVVAKIAHDFDIHVRTGAPNAGHTYYMDVTESAGHDDGLTTSTLTMTRRQKVVARSVPVGVCNPQAVLYLGAGALLDVDLLIEEVNQLEYMGLSVRPRLFVDGRAVVIDPTRHHQFEGGTSGAAHKGIGSTGEGVGPARMAHISRTTMDGYRLAWTKVDHVGDPHIRAKLNDAGITVFDNTAVLLSEAIREGANVLLEGTQGSGLSLIHGTWPYVTSTDTNAGQLLVDAGISPLLLTDILLVARTYPIRVAGNSGPLRNETNFDALGVVPETTTVTKKIRRIGAWDPVLFRRALDLNGWESRIAVTFMDYIDPKCLGSDELTNDARAWLDTTIRREVDYVGTGPDTIVVMPSARWGR